MRRTKTLQSFEGAATFLVGLFASAEFVEDTRQFKTGVRHFEVSAGISEEVHCVFKGAARHLEIATVAGLQSFDYTSGGSNRTRTDGVGRRTKLSDDLGGLARLSQRQQRSGADLEACESLGPVLRSNPAEEALREIRRGGSVASVERNRRRHKERERMAFGFSEENLGLVEAALATTQLGEPDGRL